MLVATSKEPLEHMLCFHRLCGAVAMGPPAASMVRLPLYVGLETCSGQRCCVSLEDPFLPPGIRDRGPLQPQLIRWGALPDCGQERVPGEGGGWVSLETGVFLTVGTSQDSALP